MTVVDPRSVALTAAELTVLDIPHPRTGLGWLTYDVSSDEWLERDAAGLPLLPAVVVVQGTVVAMDPNWDADRLLAAVADDAGWEYCTADTGQASASSGRVL